MIDHSLLHPTLTDRELEEGCRQAVRYGVASVCLKPYWVRPAAELLKGSGVAVGAVVGFPHGGSATEVKRYETAMACREGAVEIDMVINIGKALSGDWDYVERDIRAVCEEAHGQGAKVKVILENDYLAQGGAGLSSEAIKRQPLPVGRARGGRLGEDFHRLRVRQGRGRPLRLPRGHRGGPGSDARQRVRQGAGQSRRRRARSGWLDPRARPRGQPVRRLGHRRDSRRIQAARGGRESARRAAGARSVKRRA